MLITKFNKLIHNKLVWWIFGSIVIITFVGWFSPRGGCDKTPQASAVGTLNGAPVTAAELRQAHDNTYLSLCLMVGRVIPKNEEVETELNAQAWKRVAALRAARSMGLGATEDEVRDMITHDRQFVANGAFSRERYATFTKNVLGQLGTDITRFEQQLAENIIIQKLQNLTGAAAWVSPSDMQRIVGRYADTFDVQYVTLASNKVTGALALSDDDLRRYFDAHTNLFVIPDMVSVKYVQYPISSYLAKSSADDAAIEEYYDTHADEFSTTDTNGLKTATPLEKVRTDISNKLVRATALDHARNAAAELVVALTPARDGSAVPFDTVAAATGLTVHATSLFDAVTGPSELDANRAFIEAAFRLRSTPDEYFSDAVVATDRVYVLGLITNAETRVPDFAEVKAKVVPLAREQAKADRLAKQASELHDRLEAALKAGKSFKTAAQAEGLTVTTNAAFTVNTAPEALGTESILEDLTARGSGELTHVLEGTNGVIVAYVVNRRPASADEAAAVKAQIGANIARRRARTLFSEYEDALIRVGRKESAAAGTTSRDSEPPIVD